MDAMICIHEKVGYDFTPGVATACIISLDKGYGNI